MISAEDAGEANVAFNTGEVTQCPACGAKALVELYPAMFRPFADGHPGEKIASAEEAACFYHPQKRATVPCDACGRFLCALCDVDLNGQHLCPGCIQTGKKKGKLKNLENQRVLYDNIALMLTILPFANPLFFFTVYFTIITAPIALYLSIRHWKSPSSIVPRLNHLRFSIAIVLALLQIAAWIVLIWYLLHYS
ncbi:MAG TPA: hypothetical protein VG733_10860 [Chthoniobacteraceae bacterium]|nr:hypothetical protein [Chthoniobacteraceae bacterium]